MREKPKLKLIKGLGGVGKLPAEKFFHLRPGEMPDKLIEFDISKLIVQSTDTGPNEPIILNLHRKEEEE